MMTPILSDGQHSTHKPVYSGQCPPRNPIGNQRDDPEMSPKPHSLNCITVVTGVLCRLILMSLSKSWFWASLTRVTLPHQGVVVEWPRAG